MTNRKRWGMDVELFWMNNVCTYIHLLQELAWSSFSVLKNTNSCSMLVWRPDTGVLMARGAFARSTSLQDADQILAALGKVCVVCTAACDGVLAGLQSDILLNNERGVHGSTITQQDLAGLPTSRAGSAVLSNRSTAEYMSDTVALAAGGIQPLAAVPAGVQSALVQQLHVGARGGQPGLVVVLCERPRALSARERGWVAAVAAKLAGFV